MITDIVTAVLKVIDWATERFGRRSAQPAPAIGPIQQDALVPAPQDAVPASQPPSGVSIGPELRFESVDLYPSVKYKAFRPRWHEGPGNYAVGYDFLWLEYECARETPRRIEIHVESAQHEVQPDWNLRKQRLAARVLELLHREEPDLVWPFVRGSRTTVENMTRHKSTSVGHFDMPNNEGRNAKEIATLAMNRLHARIGHLLDEAWDG